MHDIRTCYWPSFYSESRYGSDEKVTHLFPPKFTYTDNHHIKNLGWVKEN